MGEWWYDEKNNIHYGDTPGLDDVVFRASAAKEIAQGLRANGRYKVFFMLQHKAGRPLENDLTMLEAILEAADEIHKHDFYLIFNWFKPSMKNEALNDSDTWNKLVAPLTRVISNLPLDGEHIYLNEFNFDMYQTND